MSVLLIISTVVLVNTGPLIDHYRFNRSVSRLESELIFTQRLASLVEADIDVRLENSKTGLVLIRKTDEPFVLPQTIDNPIFIPLIQLDMELIEIVFTATGWLKDPKIFEVIFKGRKKTFDFSNNLKSYSVRKKTL